MSKIKKLICLTVPIQHCNLKCEYCYISRVKDWNEGNSSFDFSIDHIINCLSKKRLGGECIINITGGGETLIPVEVIGIIEGLLKEGHFLEVVTNGTLTNRLKKILEIDSDLLRHLEFKFSFHYKELKRLNLLDTYASNVRMMRDAGCSFTIECMPYDNLENDIEDIKSFSLANFGALPQLTVGRDDMNNRKLLTNHTIDEYKKIWGEFESTMFDYKMKIYEERPKHFCYAGKWSLYVDLKTGDAQACYGQPITQNIFKDITKPMKFNPVGKYCTMPYCLNGHAFLSLGMQPDFKFSNYYEIRNRKCVNCEDKWFSDECKEAFSQKLYNNNEQLSTSRKSLVNLTQPFRYVGTLPKSYHQVLRRIRKKTQSS